MIKKILEFYISQKLHKGKRRVVRFLLKLLPYKAVRSYYGPIMHCAPNDITNVYAISGNYGHVIYNHIKNIQPSDSIFIDIGANYGLYSLVAARHLDKGKVFSFEPNPVIYPIFLKNIQLNDANNITPVQAAIGQEDGEANLCYTSSHSGVSHIVPDNDAEGKISYKVSILNIGTYKPIINASQNTKDIHIKIDVEGFEMNIIKALQTALWYENVKSIIVEIDEQNLQKFGSDTKKLYEALAKDGFTALLDLDTSKQYDGLFIRN